MTLIRGLMSALSAGMLIYASCVEMLAGDFVLDPHLWRSSVRRQACAVVSLLAGCVAMGVVGSVHSIVIFFVLPGLTGLWMQDPWRVRCDSAGIAGCRTRKFELLALCVS